MARPDGIIDRSFEKNAAQQDMQLSQLIIHVLLLAVARQRDDIQ